jgi:signal recognition particle subunit SRP54
LQKFNKTTVINEEVVKDCLKEICNALLSSDIDVRYVMKLRENIMNKFKTEEQEGGNLRILIKTAVIK